ncbi:23S rRNA (pseudouridine(1915)-N(3))-methyltransferase RlmH [Candidatus Nomurabacteria bacterium]|nr:23S rRNA (pseudouridine(1915)-N(3))-methyltransferase RlmH [Candidatus Nomurabacteria bacterium]
MFKITILCIGKFKENYWKQAQAEYLKRLSPYAKVDIIEIKEEAFSSQNQKDVITKKEAEKLLSKIPQNTTVITLHEHAKQKNSVAFSEFLSQLCAQGDHLCFVIGGPLGLHQDVLDASDHLLSFSELTFPHQMIRIILEEQLYRAITISKNKAYHY